MDDTPRSFDPSTLFRTLGWFGVILGIALIIIFATAGYNAGPVYYWGMTSAVLPIIGFVLIRRASRSGVVRRRVLNRWARPPLRDEPSSYEGARSYFHGLSLSTDNTVDDRTWDDLSMDEVIDQIDVCYSTAGTNELYTLLRTCIPPESLRLSRTKLIKRLRSDETFRMELLREIAQLDENPNHDPASILEEDALVEDRLFPLYVILSVAALLMLFSPILLGLKLGLYAIIGVFLLNMWIYFRKSKSISALVPPLRGLFRVLKQSGKIARMDFADTGFDVEELRGELSATSGLSRSFRSVLTGSAGTSGSASADIVETLTIYIKIIFLIDLIAYGRLVTGIRRLLPPLRQIYRTVGYLDAVQSIASFLEWSDAMDSPEIVDGLSLKVEGLYHPLLEEPVANSIELSRPGAIITGTNMAGKSTFLRSVGVSALLSQTIGACFSETYRGSLFLVMTSIEKHDVLEEGKSFYYAEAERIFRMIESLDDETPVLLLIDELLSGTNSLERESASVAILDYLSQHNALTLAATHDVTIARRLDDRYAVHYFTDRATDTGLSFDYLIRPGIVQTRNAIKLLSLIGYPQEVIDSALRGADEENEESGKNSTEGRR